MQDCEVGVLGVGRMGGGIAATFLRAGLLTGVYDVDDHRMSDMAQQDAERVEVEGDIASGSLTFHVVGLPDTAMHEARERVRAAIRNTGFSFLRRTQSRRVSAFIPSFS